MKHKISLDSDIIGLDVQILRLGLWLMLIYVSIQIFSIVRLIGLLNIAPYYLLCYRVLDVILIGVFVIYWRHPLRTHMFIPLLIVVLYPMLFGIVNGNINVTFFNDFVTYTFFVVKFIIFRTLLISIYARVSPDELFFCFKRRLVRLSLFVAFLSLLTAIILLGMGFEFYYQAPAEISLGAALAITGGNVFVSFLFLVYAALSGKRMIFAGVVAMFLIAYLFSGKFRLGSFRWILVATLILMLVVFVAPVPDNFTASVAIQKFAGTFYDLNLAWKTAGGALEFLKLVDSGRYLEVYSLFKELSYLDIIFGAGYGFRYEMDYSVMLELGRSIEGSVTNSHFTPLGIVSKSGIVGLLIWSAVILPGLRALFCDREISQFRFACALALCAMIVQSFFAFGFYVNIFTPFLLAVCTVVPPDVNPRFSPCAFRVTSEAY